MKILIEETIAGYHRFVTTVMDTICFEDLTKFVAVDAISAVAIQPPTVETRRRIRLKA
jgi:hypothetical protein